MRLVTIPSGLFLRVEREADRKLLERLATLLSGDAAVQLTTLLEVVERAVEAEKTGAA